MQQAEGRAESQAGTGSATVESGGYRAFHRDARLLRTLVEPEEDSALEVGNELEIVASW
jgi:hypothetical protein